MIWITTETTFTIVTEIFYTADYGMITQLSTPIIDIINIGILRGVTIIHLMDMDTDTIILIQPIMATIHTVAQTNRVHQNILSRNKEECRNTGTVKLNTRLPLIFKTIFIYL